MRLIVATRNDHKLRELEQILGDYELVPLPPEVELPPRTATRSTANALIKARATHAACGEACARRRLGYRRARSGGEAGCALGSIRGRERDGRGEPRAPDLRAARRSMTAASPMSARSPTSRADGAETVVEARCEGTLILEPRGNPRLRLRPRLRPTRHRAGRRANDGRAARCREARDQPPRPGGAKARGELGLGVASRDPDQVGAALLSVFSNVLLIALKLAAAAITGLDRDPDRGDPLLDRPHGVVRRARLRAPGGRPARRGPPLRPREGGEPRRDDRGDADPRRRRHHRLRGDPPPGHRLRDRIARRRDRRDRLLGGREPGRLRAC